MERTSAPSDHLDVVQAVREARFAHGLICPHCESRKVIRWGGFSGRQRYRCKSCRRTFSDLTRTAFAYAKKIGKWPHYLVLMRQGRTLRASAARLEIQVSTAFRWRHALLSPMREVDRVRLTGTVEVKELLFAHSRKGSRNLNGARKRGARSGGWRWNQVARDHVLLALSRVGAAHSCTIGGDAVVIQNVREWAARRLAGRCTLYGRMPRAGAFGSPIRAAGHDYQMLRIITAGNGLSTHHTRNVDAYGRRLLSWIQRFRGVASRYLDNYLLWHRRVDADDDLLWACGMIGDGIPPSAADPAGGSGHVMNSDRPP
jgi:transposase-like protein